MLKEKTAAQVKLLTLLYTATNCQARKNKSPATFIEDDVDESPFLKGRG
jgi:hypothetical protein